MTKVVSLAARYYAVNNTDVEILLNDSESVYRIAPHSQEPVHFNPANFECINLRTLDSEKWSAAFDIKSTGKVYVRENGTDRLFRISRSMRSPSFFMSFSFTDSWPYVIQNHSSVAVSFRQKVKQDVEKSSLERGCFQSVRVQGLCLFFLGRALFP